MKKSNKNLYFFNSKQTKFKTTKNNIIKKTEIISMLTFCQNCKKETTKKNKINNHYVCNKCKSLDQEIKQETPKYVNWDADLDYLYRHFWLDDTK
ncbi:hypothetical protein D3C87_78740 [compost metagenome]